jgi:2-oxoisovalerate dehydrogenase E2 component (dihydrolipoyl transacylase)
MGEVQQFRLPDVGEGLTEADIIRWHVGQGDPVAVNQPIVEVETAKALVELPSPFGGVVHELLVAEGQTVSVGDAIISVRPADVPVPSVLAEDEPGMALVGYGPGGPPSGRTRRGDRPALRPAQVAPASRTTAAASTTTAPVRTRVKPCATPPVRKLARELRVDLAAITGTGPHGSVTRDDVRQAQAGPPEGDHAECRPENGTERIPVRGVFKHMAAAMTASAFTAPHVTEFLDVDVTATAEVVRMLREQPEFAGVKVTPTLLAARALVLAAQRNRRINATWSDTEIIVGPDINLGIAVATGDGLIVPNIKRAQNLTLAGLARKIDGLTTDARSRATPPADLTGGTITLTNVGVFGIDAGTPILVPGESAILALGAIRERPWVHEGTIAIRQVVTLALSFDHRLIDGELGARVLRDIGDVLTTPLLLVARG